MLHVLLAATIFYLLTPSAAVASVQMSQPVPCVLLSAPEYKPVNQSFYDASTEQYEAVVDSGSTHHIVPDERMLHTVFTRMLSYVDGMGKTPCTAVGNGTVVYYVANDDRSKFGRFTSPVDLHDILVSKRRLSLR